MDREDALDAARALCDAVFAPFLASECRYLAERTPVHAHHLPLISQIYPDSRCIHIVRDGRDVARSLVSQDFGPDSVTDAAREWRSAIDDARAAGLSDSRYREIRYEDLLTDPEAVFAGLCAWLDLPASAEIIEQGVAESRAARNVDRFSRPGVAAGKWRLDFGRSDLEEFNAVAGDLIEDLGYERVEPAALPGTAKRVRGIRRAAANRVRELLPRRQPGAPAQHSEGAHRQWLVDRVVEAVRDRDSERLGELLVPDALIRVIGETGHEQTARDSSGRAILARVLRDDPAIDGPQLRGDVFPALPHFAVVLTIRMPDRRITHRILFLEFRGEEIVGLTLLQFPTAASAADEDMAPQGGHSARTQA